MKNTNLIIGKINSGKTKGVMFNEVKKLIENNENLLILDNKEEYFKTFKNVLDNSGYNTMVFNLKDTYKSNSFNPLLLPYGYYKENNKDKAVELISDLATEIFKSDSSSCDPYWENSSVNYFIALTLILFKEGKEDQINIGSIQAMLSMSEQKLDDARIIDKYFSALDVFDSIYITGSAIVYAPKETRESIISVMKQKMNAYCMREQLLNNLAGSDIDFTQINSKTAIFIIGNDSINSLANILINQCVTYNLVNAPSFVSILDDVCDMPVLLKLNEILNNKMRVFVVSRDEEMLKDKYGKFIVSKFENIIENFEVNDFMELGNSSDYPTSKSNSHSYFNLREFVKDM